MSRSYFEGAAGFTHQDPGFVDLVVNKKADIVRVYFPPASIRCSRLPTIVLRTYDRINVIVAGKQPSPQWLTMQQAATHCDAGIWPCAATEAEGLEPDVVMACAGDVPTLETLAAVDLLRKASPDLWIRQRRPPASHGYHGRRGSLVRDGGVSDCLKEGVIVQP